MNFFYEPAKAALETFCSERPALVHPYNRLLGVVCMIAAVDYAEADDPLSFAWQEVDVGFRGYGDEVMTGAIMYLWKYVPEGEEKKLRGLLGHAFSEAWEMSSDCEPIHHSKHRRASIRDLEMGFDKPTAIPIRGPRFERWAKSNGLDPVLTEALIQQRMRELDDEDPPRPPLRVVR